MKISPQPGPQTAFLASPADIVIFGGAAGGGKSYALLLEPLRHIRNADFRAVIFRRTSKQIMESGGLWDTSMKIYKPFGAEAVQQPQPTWTFPSGAKVSFSHLQLENTKYDWDGSQIALMCFDELIHFSSSQFFYMLSRNRSTCGVKPYVRATTNPRADSWVREFISWWIDESTGYPIPERSGTLRYMIRAGNNILWGDTPEEVSREFMKQGLAEEAPEPKSVTFISSKLSDNKILMENDPGYRANLLAQTNVERERLLYGNWKIMPQAGDYFPREKVEIIETLPNDVRWVRAWDLAATEDRKLAREAGTVSKTAGVLLGKRKNGDYIVGDVVNRAMKAEDVRRTVLNTAKLDKEKYGRVRIRMTQDPAQAGKEQAEQYIRMLAGFNVTAVRETGDKETRAEGFASQWQAGNVKILKADWNAEYIDQLESFPEGKLKDMVDASSNAFNELTKMNTVSVPKKDTGPAHRSLWIR